MVALIYQVYKNQAMNNCTSYTRQNNNYNNLFSNKQIILANISKNDSSNFSLTSKIHHTFLLLLFESLGSQFFYKEKKL